MVLIVSNNALPQYGGGQQGFGGYPQQPNIGTHGNSNFGQTYPSQQQHGYDAYDQGHGGQGHSGQFGGQGHGGQFGGQGHGGHDSGHGHGGGHGHGPSHGNSHGRHGY